MIARAVKLRFRRHLRMQKRQVEVLGQQAEQQLERNFFKRLERLIDVRRFLSTWMLLIVLLGSCVAAQWRSLGAYYQTVSAVPGGTYSEGVLGTFTNANPLYAVDPVDVTVSRLVFAGLFTYNNQNQLVGDLAKDYVIDERGTTYTVHLRPDLRWHDGKPLTAADVVFTYQLIQNPDARSPLESSWRGIQVVAVDPLTVNFTLPNQLVSFPYSLTNGIVPQHVLADEAPTALRSLPFNSSRPVGSGPFKFSQLQVSGNSAEDREEFVALDAFDGYHVRRPALDRFVVHAFHNKDRMIQAFQSHEITAMVGLTEVPPKVDDANARFYSLPLTAAVMTFFKTTEGVLSDVGVRQALIRAADVPTIIKNLGYATLPVREPLLRNQVGYNPVYAQAGFDVAAANAMLDQAGWLRGTNGIRAKASQPLAFSLTVQENGEYAKVAQMLRQQWHMVGADVSVDNLTATDFQQSLSEHTYDALLHGISIGTDPDVYVYWDSTSADARSDSRLNFSEYHSAATDAALRAGRTRADPALRAIKYQPFLQAWQADAPALALYQPRMLYITRTPVNGLTEHTINSDIDRLNNVQDWMTRQAGVSQKPMRATE